MRLSVPKAFFYMAELEDKIAAEIENIEHLLKVMPASNSLQNLSILELAGVATLLHNFYNGIENILKQILISQQLSIPSGNSWHKELLNAATDNKIISNTTKELLGGILLFVTFIVTHMLWIYIPKEWNHW